MKELNVKVGDKVIVSGRWTNDEVATVVKVTPTGRIKIDIDKYTQYDKYGREMGCDNKLSSWGVQKFLKVCTPEDEERIKEAATIRTVIKYMHEVKKINIDQARAIWNILHPSQDMEEWESERYERKSSQYLI